MDRSLGIFIFLFIIAGLLQAAIYLWAEIPLEATYLWESYVVQGFMGGLSLVTWDTSLFSTPT